MQPWSYVNVCPVLTVWTWAVHLGRGVDVVSVSGVLSVQCTWSRVSSPVPVGERDAKGLL
jgi:hypothetical protein